MPIAFKAATAIPPPTFLMTAAFDATLVLVAVSTGSVFLVASVCVAIGALVIEFGVDKLLLLA
jgi:hypothetical protein